MELAILFLVSLSLSAILGQGSLLLFWVLMETMTVLFIIFVIVWGSLAKEEESQLLFYFLVQSSVSLVMLSAVMGHLFFLQELAHLLVLCVVIKLGLAPFFFWVVKVSKFLSNFGFLFLMIPQKVFLLYFLFTFMDDLGVGFCWISLFTGGFMMILSFEIKDVIIASSMGIALFFFIMFCISPSLFFFGFGVYSLAIMLFVLVQEENLFSLNLFYGGLLLLSSPLSYMFLLKFQLFQFTYNFLGEVGLLVFWLGLLVCFLGYFSVFYTYFVQLKNVYSLPSLGSGVVLAALSSFFLFL